MEVDDPWHWSIDRVVQELCTPDRSWQLPPSTTVPDMSEFANILRQQGVNGNILLLEVDDNALRNDFNFKTLSQRAFVRRAIEELRMMSAQYRAHAGRVHHHNVSLSLPSSHIGGVYPAPFSPRLDNVLPPGPGRDTPVLQMSPGTPDSIINLLPPASPSEQVSHESRQPSTPIDSRTSRGEFVIPDALGNKRRKLDLTHSADNLGDEIADEPSQITQLEIEQSPQGQNATQQSPSAPLSELDISPPAERNEIKRRRIAPVLFFGREAPTLHRQVLTEADDVLHHNPENTEPDVPTQKKRRRIAPVLVSSRVDLGRDRRIPTEADSVLHHSPENIEPGVPFITDDGKKRVVPIHQPRSDLEAPYNYDNLLPKSGLLEGPPVNKGSDQSLRIGDANLKLDKKASLSLGPRAIGYLGKQKTTVDDIFYEGTAVGQELSSEDPTELSVCHKQFPSGQRLYVHQLIKGYLRSEPKVFTRDNGLFYAVSPYPSRLAPKFHSASFTLFHTNVNGKIVSKREEVTRWPEIDTDAPLQSSQASMEGSRLDSNLGVFNEFGSYAETFDPDCLAKYLYVQGGDEVLPIYGESDEDNEYDLDTWAEMEEERGTLEKPSRPLKKPLLTLKDINQAIDEGITELVAKWQREQLPKMQRKAFRIWKRFRNNRNNGKNREARRGYIASVQKHLDRINDDRIPKLRKEICGEAWTSQLQVRKQTRIMEQSIFDRESSVWEIGILKGTNAPEKPLPKASASSSSKLAPPTQDCEEGESVGSDSEASSSDEDMSDFVVDDVSSGAEEIEMNLADSADEDDAVSSDSSPATSTRMAPRVRLTIKRSHTKYVPSDEDPVLDGLDDASQSAVPTDTGPRMLDGLSTPGALKQIPVRDESALPDLPPMSSNTHNDPIDLTMLSSDDAPSTPAINLVTPSKKKPVVKLLHRGSPFSGSPIAISDDEMLLPDMDNLPPYTDPDAISTFTYEVWSRVSDRARLLISVVNKMDENSRTALFTFLRSVSENELWGHMSDAVGALLAGESGLKGVDNATFQTLIWSIRLFSTYANCKYSARKQPSEARLRKLSDKRAEWFPAFYLLCQELEGYFSKSASAVHRDRGGDSDATEDDEDLTSAVKRRRAVNATSEDDGQDAGSQHKKRKRMVFEDKEARDMREMDRMRLEEQETRRKKLQKHLPYLEHAEGQQQIIINDSKYDHQGFVYISKQIAPRIKQHQIEGVRFMWSQIITDEKSMQGCLLAHTMGLGKTLQVITLLSAIAEASGSLDESVYSQVPLSLRASKTLVLCPAGLINNWMDELLTWTPHELLGDFRKVDSSMKMNERLRTISKWYHDGGVLILSYEMYRGLYDNKGTVKRDPPLGEEDHETVKGQLLNGPNIIVADEAHKMKNAETGIAQSTAQFRSMSRIALTGSPLANNVMEYHTMINWVAPNYLGPSVEFRAKYVEPIEEGLWGNSSTSERRKSLKMLGVLKKDLAPKVHRADMSVLRNELPPKKEFVITVPLTELQKKAYTLYVQSMVSTNTKTTKDGDFSQTTIWSWLAILSLLCNHPLCFNNKLTERREEAQNAQRALPASRSSADQEDGITTDLNVPIWKVGVSQDLINKVTELFKQETEDITAIDLSNKVKILCQILDASKIAGDKVLIFSQSIPTLDFLQNLCISQKRKIGRLDGSTAMNKRQEATKLFNIDDTEIYLISTAAGGLGLNMYGANRVVIFDFKFNPIMEEQAVGRAYRIGQQKPVYVYRFMVGGTFEDSIHNKAVFKTQLASRVVDKKSPVAWARKRLGDILFEPKDIKQNDLSEFKGMDPLVLDGILTSQSESSTIRGIVQSDTFERDDDDKLTAEEEKEVQQLLDDEQLKRSDPMAWHQLLQKRSANERNRQMGLPIPTPGMHATLGGYHMKPTTPAPPKATVGARLQADRAPILPPPRAYSMGGNAATAVNSPKGAPSVVQPGVPSNLAQVKSPLGTPSIVQLPRGSANLAQAKSPMGAASGISSDLPSRSIAPGDKSVPSLSTSKNISPSMEKATYSTPAKNEIPSSADARSDQNPENKIPVTRRTTQHETEAILPEAIKQPHEFATPRSMPEPHQLSKPITDAVAEGATDGAAEVHAEKTTRVLRDDNIKRQALVTSQMSPSDFARSIVKSISPQLPSSSGELKNVEESTMFKAMNRTPAPRSLRTPVAKPPMSGRKKTPHSTDDARRMHRALKSRVPQPKTTPTSSTPSTKLPRWAESEIREASRGLDQRRASSRGTPSMQD